MALHRNKSLISRRAREREEQRREAERTQLRNDVKKDVKELLGQYEMKDHRWWLKKARSPLLWGAAFATLLLAEGFKTLYVGYLEDNDVNSRLTNQFGLIQSENMAGGSCIHGGIGESTYGELSNHIARGLSEQQYDDYGFCRPTRGSAHNIEKLSLDGYETSLALFQKDVYRTMKENGSADHVTILADIPEVPECAFLPSSGRFGSLNELSAYTQQQAAKKADGQASQPLRIAVPPEGSGSYFTAQNIVRYALDENGVELVQYNNSAEMIKAVNDGDADIGVFVEYPGLAQGKFLGALSIALDANSAFMPITESEFGRSFASVAEGYNLMQVTVVPKLMTGYPVASFNSWRAGSVEHQPMICTNAMVGGRNINSLNAAVNSVRYDLSDFQDAVRNIDTSELEISPKPHITVLATPKLTQ